ncbi:MAG: WYL domain-containing protein [Nannocystaceae bacterium]|nr:WYL domain-containing protein [Myxococcales bacterium]
MQETARVVLRYLRDHPDGATKDELSRHAGVAAVTTQRALKYMRETWDAPLQFRHGTKHWLLLDRGFTLPLTDPEPEDLNAVVFAAALLAPVADEDLNNRVSRLIEQMDAAVEESRAHTDSKMRPRSVTATVTTGTTLDSRLVSKLVTAIGKSVVRIEYDSPWSGTRKSHDLEPWQLRIHDGAMYLRAYSRTTGGPRSFRVAQIIHARVLPGETPREPVPPRHTLWGNEDPGYGIDSDRPGVATLRIRGGVARWVRNMQWDAGQEDRWIEEGDLLERRVPYNSCREFARRLLSIVDGLEGIEPAELREEVISRTRGFLERVG